MRKDELKNIPIDKIVKIQSVFRGMKVRKQIRETRGFVVKSSMMFRKSFSFPPEVVEQNKLSVQKIYDGLPNYDYGELTNEERDVLERNDTGDIIWPTRQLPDGSDYTGTWR